jgi:paraquat-inducible protein B
MAKQANTMVIGGFVILAVFLLISSIVVFGSGNFFKNIDEYIFHFEGSIKGLNVGAPVLFEGVRIGKVTNIVATIDETQLTTDIRVIAEIYGDSFLVKNELEERDSKDIVSKLINKGLRGVLAIQSLVTGQLLIELGYNPGSPAKFKEEKSHYIEIPTTSSDTRRFVKSLQNLDVEALDKTLNSVLSGLDRLVNDPAILSGAGSLNKTIDELKGLITKIDSHVDPLAESLQETLGDTRRLLNNADRQVAPVTGDLKKILVNFNNVVRDTDSSIKLLTNNLDDTLEKLNGIVSEDSPLIIEMQETLSKVSTMSSSIRQLADYLERHPEALLRGKGPQ